MIRYIFFIIVSLVLAIGTLRAESLFLPPSRAELYLKNTADLAPKELSKMKVFGLRMAALDPNIWGVLISDRTDNRNLVAIRPYYLLASANSDFELQGLSFQFKFQYASTASLEQTSHVKESVFDINFGGHYVKSGNQVQKDDSYVLRLSASPFAEPGLYYRSFSKFKLLHSFSEKIETGKIYLVSIDMQGNIIKMNLDNKEILSYPLSAHRGLVSLITGWNPIWLKNFKISALDDKNLKEFNGIVQIGK